MRKLLVHWWQACVAGILVGIPIGITLELARRRYNDAASVEIDHQFERQGMSPPLIVDFLQPWVVPILTTMIFVLLALLIHIVIRQSRISRTTFLTTYRERSRARSANSDHDK